MYLCKICNIIFEFSKNELNWTKVTVKTLIDSLKISVLNKCFWMVYSSKDTDCFTVFTKILSIINVLITIHFFWASNKHIRVISKGSCDTEYWSNDAGNAASHHRNKINVYIYIN